MLLWETKESRCKRQDELCGLEDFRTVRNKKQDLRKRTWDLKTLRPKDEKDKVEE